MSLLTSREEVLGLIQELQGKFDITRAHLNKYINDGYRAFVRDTKCIEDRIDVTTVANKFEYATADAANIAFILQINEVRHIESGQTEVGRPLKPFPGSYGGLPEEYVYGRPIWYWMRGMLSEDLTTNNARRLGVWPIDSTSSNTIRLHVSRMPLSDLSADGDQPEIEPAWHEAIEFYAAMKFFRKYGHEKPVWRRKYLELKAEYQELVSNYIMNSSVEYTELQTIIEV